MVNCKNDGNLTIKYNIKILIRENLHVYISRVFSGSIFILTLRNSSFNPLFFFYIKSSVL